MLPNLISLLALVSSFLAWLGYCGGDVVLFSALIQNSGKIFWLNFFFLVLFKFQHHPYIGDSSLRRVSLLHSIALFHHEKYIYK